MKKTLPLICSMTFSGQAVTAETREKSNVLIAYFSRAGEKYSVGIIEKSNTELPAKIIADNIGSDMLRIEPVVPYPEGYDDTKTIVTQERNDNARPEIKDMIENFNDYDVIFVGYTIWWGDMPMIMYTFLESYDWTDKVVIPFNTHKISGSEGTYDKIASALPNAQVLDSMAIQGKTAQDFSSDTQQAVRDWLDNLGF